MTSPTFTVRSVQAFCYRYPLSTPVVTSFGRMLNRPAVFVRVEDEDGNTGWGEVWSNFPSTGAEHRARLVNEVLAPAMSGIAVSEPVADLRAADAGYGVLACNAASLDRSRRPSRASTSRCGICMPDAARPPVEIARRRPPTDQGLCQRHQSDRLAADGGSGAGSRAPRTETEDWFRACERSRQSRVAS